MVPLIAESQSPSKTLLPHPTHCNAKLCSSVRRSLLSVSKAIFKGPGRILSQSVQDWMTITRRNGAKGFWLGEGAKVLGFRAKLKRINFAICFAVSATGERKLVKNADLSAAPPGFNGRCQNPFPFLEPGRPKRASEDRNLPSRICEGRSRLSGKSLIYATR
jgi:hypothetical protein